MNATKQLAAIEKQRAALTEQVREILQSGATEIFNKYPALVSFGWKQYTPSFNDGDPCTLSVNYYDLILNGVDPNDDDDDDEENELPELSEADSEAADKEIYELLNLIPETTYEELFGSDVIVTVTRDGITTESYDCGY